MHPPDCPQNWEYRQHTKVGILADRCAKMLTSLRNGRVVIDDSTRDTRASHEQLFTELTPPNSPCFAGHYRGEPFRCIEYYEVRIDGDPRVGVPAGRVAADIANLADNIVRAGFSALKVGFSVPDSRLPPEEKLYYLVTFACRVLVEFLRVHPYANGNGHMGRWIVWLILFKFGYWPQKWPLDTSPPYARLIELHRDGNPSPLESYVLDCVAG